MLPLPEAPLLLLLLVITAASILLLLARLLLLSVLRGHSMEIADGCREGVEHLRRRFCSVLFR